jgi:hypothetical protein
MSESRESLGGSIEGVVAVAGASPVDQGVLFRLRDASAVALVRGGWHYRVTTHDSGFQQRPKRHNERMQRGVTQGLSWR